MTYAILMKDKSKKVCRIRKIPYSLLINQQCTFGAHTTLVHLIHLKHRIEFYPLTMEKIILDSIRNFGFMSLPSKGFYRPKDVQFGVGQSCPLNSASQLVVLLLETEAKEPHRVVAPNSTRVSNSGLSDSSDRSDVIVPRNL